MCASRLDVSVFLIQTVLIPGVAIPANVKIMENFSHQHHTYTTYLMYVQQRYFTGDEKVHKAL